MPNIQNCFKCCLFYYLNYWAPIDFFLLSICRCLYNLTWMHVKPMLKQVIPCKTPRGSGWILGVGLVIHPLIPGVMTTGGQYCRHKLLLGRWDFFPYSLFSCYLQPLWPLHFSFLLFPYASVWDNTCACVSYPMQNPVLQQSSTTSKFWSTASKFWATPRFFSFYNL